VVGLGSRKKGAVALALTAFASAAVIGAVRGGQLDRKKARSGGQDSASGGTPEVERSITIGKTADKLRDCWLDPRTLAQVLAGFATVRATGDGRMHWLEDAPRGYDMFKHKTDGCVRAVFGP
jgi:uncharacterized membrane protein